MRRLATHNIGIISIIIRRMMMLWMAVTGAIRITVDIVITVVQRLVWMRLVGGEGRGRSGSVTSLHRILGSLR